MSAAFFLHWSARRISIRIGIGGKRSEKICIFSANDSPLDKDAAAFQRSQIHHSPLSLPLRSSIALQGGNNKSHPQRSTPPLTGGNTISTCAPCAGSSEREKRAAACKHRPLPPINQANDSIPLFMVPIASREKTRKKNSAFYRANRRQAEGHTGAEHDVWVREVAAEVKPTPSSQTRYTYK